MLTQTLRELEADELIVRKVYLEVPPKVEYSLTDSGKELIPFIGLMRSWGEKQMSKNWNLQFWGCCDVFATNGLSFFVKSKISLQKKLLKLL